MITVTDSGACISCDCPSEQCMRAITGDTMSQVLAQALDLGWVAQPRQHPETTPHHFCPWCAIPPRPLGGTA